MFAFVSFKYPPAIDLLVEIVDTSGRDVRFTYMYKSCLQIFSGNYDRYIIVQHKFVKPLYGRYFRVYPVAWYSWIGLRVEFYGCVYGENHSTVLVS